MTREERKTHTHAEREREREISSSSSSSNSSSSSSINVEDSLDCKCHRGYKSLSLSSYLFSTPRATFLSLPPA
jgi:hypothetical protein